MGSTEEDYLQSKYGKEALNSLTRAQAYRKKINPEGTFSDTEALEVRGQIIRRVTSDLSRRIHEGYPGIDLSLVELSVDTFLKELSII